MSQEVHTLGNGPKVCLLASHVPTTVCLLWTPWSGPAHQDQELRCSPTSSPCSPSSTLLSLRVHQGKHAGCTRQGRSHPAAVFPTVAFITFQMLGSGFSWSFLSTLQVVLGSIIHGQGQILKCARLLRILAFHYFFFFKKTKSFRTVHFCGVDVAVSRIILIEVNVKNTQNWVHPCCYMYIHGLCTFFYYWVVFDGVNRLSLKRFDVF